MNLNAVREKWKTIALNLYHNRIKVIDSIDDEMLKLMLDECHGSKANELPLGKISNPIPTSTTASPTEAMREFIAAQNSPFDFEQLKQYVNERLADTNFAYNTLSSALDRLLKNNEIKKIKRGNKYKPAIFEKIIK